MSKYASETEVPIERSKGEIERTLVRYGASSFVYGWDQGRAVIGFEVNHRRYRVTIPLPRVDDPQFTRTEVRRTLRSKQAALDAWEQSTRQKWRALALFIKSTLEADESGIISLAQVFTTFVVLPSGQTVGEWLAPQIEQVYKTGYMPPMLPGLPAGAEETE